jgi:hypothetical protein
MSKNWKWENEKKMKLKIANEKIKIIENEIMKKLKSREWKNWKRENEKVEKERMKKLNERMKN